MKKFLRKIKLVFVSKERLLKEKESLQSRINRLENTLKNVEKLTANYIENNQIMYNLTLGKYPIL